ncbi:MAG: hypothetical protein ACWA41_00900 [Putridiphycobacter sp.]
MKRLLTVVLLVIVSSLNAQEDPKKDWRIQTAMGFAPGFLSESTQSIQVQGMLGFLKNKIELRGDSFYFMGNSGQRPRFSMNHQLYAGAFYHFLDNQFQPYLGFQPGVAWSQSSEFGTLNNETGLVEYKPSFNPVASIAGGFDLYADKWFYLFVEARQIFGKHKSNSYPVYLDEFRFSFGLGFTF